MAATVSMPERSATAAAQLEENLGSAEVTLGPRQLAALEAVSRPVLDFPAHNVAFMGHLAYGGSRINGSEYSIVPFAPRRDEERY